MAAETFDTSWMWHPSFHGDSTTTAGLFVHFRKSLDVADKIPESLMIQITADTRYKLYINSQLVAFGPVKGDANLWFYDEIDISTYLRLGENNIAIHVLRLFHGTSHATSFPRLGTGGVKIATVVEDTIWAPQIRSSTRWQAAVDPFVTLRVDEPEDDFLHIYEKVSRTTPALLAWTPAILLRFQNSTGVTAPWKLSPRLIPPMAREEGHFKAIHNVKSCISKEVWDSAIVELSSQDNDLRLPPGTNHQLDLEVPNYTTGFVRFRFKRPDMGGASLTVTYSESYEDPPELVPYLRRKTNRRDTSKLLIGPQDSYIFQGHDGNLRLGYYPKDDTEEAFIPFHWRAFVFIRLNIDVGSSDLVFRGIDVDAVHYPLKVLSSVSGNSTDGMLEKLYDTSIRTLQNCMHDCYEDCPFYEQLQYAMDTRSSSLFTYYASADDRLARQAIIQLHSSFQPLVGLTASRAPSSQLQIIPHFSLYWICMLYDHYMFYDDKDFIRPFLPVMDAVLGYFHFRIDSGIDLVALKSSREVWNFHDWTAEWRPYGIPPSVVKSGISSYTNSLYAYTLNMASKLQLTCGNRPGLADEYSDRASRIANAVRRNCFDGRYFTDSLALTSDPKVDRSQHSQVWAVLSGAISGTDAQDLLIRALGSSKDGETLIKTSISMSFYTLRAISVAGGSLYNDAFAEFWRPWREQVALGLTTWEEDGVSHRSDCHAWGSAPIYEFLGEVAGIRPAKPGWKEIEFAPRVSLYPSFEATVPFHQDRNVALAKVSWKSVNQETRVTLSITGLHRPLSIHVKMPQQPVIVMSSTENLSFIYKSS